MLIVLLKRKGCCSKQPKTSLWLCPIKQRYFFKSYRKINKISAFIPATAQPMTALAISMPSFGYLEYGCLLTYENPSKVLIRDDTTTMSIMNSPSTDFDGDVQNQLLLVPLSSSLFSLSLKIIIMVKNVMNITTTTILQTTILMTTPRITTITMTTMKGRLTVHICSHESLSYSG